MNITLILVFPLEDTILTRTWDLSLPSTDPSFPHLFMVSFQVAHVTHQARSYCLNYPHTGDIHTIKPFKESSHEITFVSRQTDTSQILIWGEVVAIREISTGTTYLNESRQIIEQLSLHDWKSAKEAEHKQWKNWKTGK